MSERIKAADIYRLVGYTRNQLRGLLDALGHDQFNEGAKTQARVARTYSTHEFLVILVACELESSLGLKRSSIVSLVPQIARELSGPRAVARQPKLVLTIAPPTAQYVDGEDAVNQGLVLPLSHIFTCVDQHLQKTGNYLSLAQAALNFGPSLVETGTFAEEDVNSNELRRASR